MAVRIMDKMLVASPALTKIIETAQRDADTCGKDLMVFNLNPFSPLYVIRNYDARLAGNRDLVCVVEAVR